MAITTLVDPSALREEERSVYSVPAEAGVLACIMQRPSLIYEAERLIRPEWFMIQIHGLIYRLMLTMAHTAAKNGWQLSFGPAEAMVVAQQCGSEMAEHFLKRTDGMETWNRIALRSQAIAATEQFPRFIAALRDRAARVALHRKGRQLQLSAMDMDANPDASKVAMGYEAELSRIAFGSNDEKDGRLARLGDYVDPFVEETRLNDLYPEKHLFHLAHPRFIHWMKIMGGGFRRNSLTMVCARSKVGKSTLLAELASDFAMGDQILDATDRPLLTAPVPTLFLDTEMSGPELVSRQLSNIGGIDESELLAGKWNGSEVGIKIMQQAECLKRAPFFYICVAGRPIEYIVSMIRQFVTQYVGTEVIRGLRGEPITITRPCAVFYDWLKIPATDLNDGFKEYQAMGNVATLLKDTAKSLSIPIIAGAQQNRTGIGKSDREQLENYEGSVGGSDRLIHFCNTLVILRNPSLDMQEAIEAKWGNVYPNAPEGSARWRFNQLLAVVVQRQGREQRTGIPMRLVHGRAHYEEVSDADTINWVKEFYKQKKVNRRNQAAKDASARQNTPSTVPAVDGTPK